MRRVLDGLIDDVGFEIEERTQTGRDRRPQVADVINPVRVQRNSGAQCNLRLVGGSDGANDIASAPPALLGDGDNGRNIVAGMGRFRRHEIIVEVQLADCGCVGPSGPAALEALVPGEP